MRQRLPVKSQSLSSLHGIIHIKVLHAEDILIDVELTQIPVIRQLVPAAVGKKLSTYQIMDPNALIAVLDETISLIDCGTEGGRGSPSSSSSSIVSPSTG